MGALSVTMSIVLKMDVIMLPVAVLEALLEISDERVEYGRGVVA